MNVELPQDIETAREARKLFELVKVELLSLDFSQRKNLVSEFDSWVSSLTIPDEERASVEAILSELRELFLEPDEKELKKRSNALQKLVDSKKYKREFATFMDLLCKETSSDIGKKVRERVQNELELMLSESLQNVIDEPDTSVASWELKYSAQLREISQRMNLLNRSDQFIVSLYQEFRPFLNGNFDCLRFFYDFLGFMQRDLHLLYYDIEPAAYSGSVEVRAVADELQVMTGRDPLILDEDDLTEVTEAVNSILDDPSSDKKGGGDLH